MHEGELWQVFGQNGEPIDGRGEIDDGFARDPSLVMANAHVWLWCLKRDGGRAILLQKRSNDRKRSPGKYHISAAGHVNVGESSVAAGVREAKEEMGISIDPQRLYFVQTVRGGRSGESLNSVFIHQVDEKELFSFDDGEVDSVKWVDIKDFEQMTRDADRHNIIDQGDAYFTPLITAIKRQ